MVDLYSLYNLNLSPIYPNLQDQMKIIYYLKLLMKNHYYHLSFIQIYYCILLYLIKKKIYINK